MRKKFCRLPNKQAVYWQVTTKVRIYDTRALVITVRSSYELEGMSDISNMIVSDPSGPIWHSQSADDVFLAGRELPCFIGFTKATMRVFKPMAHSILATTILGDSPFNFIYGGQIDRPR